MENKIKLEDIFTKKEIKRIERIETIGDKEYTKEDIIKLQNKIAENVITSSKKTDINEAREDYNLVDKLNGIIQNKWEF